MAGDVFHGVVIVAIDGAGIVKADNVRMAKKAQGVDLALKAPEKARFLSQVGRQNLDRGLPGRAVRCLSWRGGGLRNILVSQVHASHPAATQLSVDHPVA